MNCANEDRQTKLAEEFKAKLTVDSMANLLARIQYAVESAFYFGDTDEIGDDLCVILELDPCELEQK